MVIRLGPGAEFDRIRAFLERAPEHGAAVEVGPGDDAAVLAGGITLSVDMSVEDVHYRRAWLSPREVGYRASAGAISDLAAMAAEPIGILTSIALGPEDDEEYGRQLMQGLGEAAAAHGGSVLGGDLTRSPGPAFIDVTAIVRASLPVLRSGARPGDEVWVTGQLGAAAAAVASWLAGDEPPDWARKAFARPVARVREAVWLRERVGLSAMIDLSDGIAGDAGHIAAASGVRLVIDGPALPVADEAVDTLRAAGGGEDYELCFTAPAGAVVEHQVAFRREFGIRLTRVGRVEEGSGAVVLDEEGRPMDAHGFQHWRRG